MVGGQYIDVSGTVEGDGAQLRRLHELKTGRQIGAAIECVLLLTDDHTRSTTLPDFRAFATELGVLFQIVDDILDVTGTDVALGKPQGSDERHGKVTYVSRYGLDGARAMAAESHSNARAALDRAAGAKAEELAQITDFIATRTS
jgi:geranylgeranyl diphosphate synthase type II